MLTVVKEVVSDSLVAPTESQYEGPSDEGGGRIPKQIVRDRWVLVESVVLLVNLILAFLRSIVSLIFPLPEKSLRHEIVLITGAGRGIGRSLSWHFATERAELVLVDREENLLKETKDVLLSAGFRRLHCYRLDVSNREEVLSVGQKIFKEVGPVGILVNNAGIMPCRPLLSTSADDVSRTFNVNILAHFYMLEAFLPEMKKRNHGHVVAISSLCGINALPNLAPYCASKFAVRGLMDSLYEELRSEKSKVCVTSVYPYMVDTGLIKKPKSRFPEAFKLITADEVATAVVKAVRTNLREISVPSSLLASTSILRLLPDTMVELIKDFLETGVDPDD